jgi:hypothetical protein
MQHGVSPYKVPIPRGSNSRADRVGGTPPRTFEMGRQYGRNAAAMLVGFHKSLIVVTHLYREQSLEYPNTGLKL